MNIAQHTTESISRLSPHWVSLFLIGALFAAPVSSSAESIFIVLALVFILITPDYRAGLRPLLFSPWCLSGFFLFLFSLLGCTWTSASAHDALVIVGKYSKLLYLPLFVIGFRDRETRLLATHAFILAMLLTCIISLLKVAHLINYHGEDPGYVFRNHIMTGYMMAFAAYLCAFLSIKTKGKLGLLYGILTLLFSYQVLFLGTGRTSYLIYLVLMVLLMWHVFSWRQAVVAGLVVCSLFTVIYHESEIMQHRAQEAVSDWNAYHHDGEKNTPVGFRLQFHAYAHTLFNRHPWIGNGTSGFSDTFKREHPVPGWGPVLFEPHSQYWLVAADSGMVGLVLFALYFGCLFLASATKNEARPIAIALLVSFLLGSLFDSLLLYAGTGYFFLLFMALCLAEGRFNQA